MQIEKCLPTQITSCFQSRCRCGFVVVVVVVGGGGGGGGGGV